MPVCVGNNCFSDKMIIHYDIGDVAEYINWLYFFHAWGLTGKPETEKMRLRAEAEEMLGQWSGRYRAHALAVIADANSDGDDIIANGVRIPFLRQQEPSDPGQPCLCLADFVRPASMGIADKIGLFATTVDEEAVKNSSADCYSALMAQTFADRLAEAAAEKLHQQVRTRIWGYAPNEILSVGDLLSGRYQGIRPAVGYPSMPDTGINFVLDSIIGFPQIGIRLTESGMMIPHASVSGLMLSHPEVRYFDIGTVGDDQLEDYARRRGLPVETIRKFVKQ